MSRRSAFRRAPFRPADVLAVEADLAARRVEQAHDQARRRALATTGLADEPERLAAAHVEADAVHRLHGAGLALEDHAARDREVLDQVADLDERAHDCVPSPARAACACFRRVPGAQLGPQTPPRLAIEQARDLVRRLARNRLQPRVDPLVIRLRVGAARVEVTARRTVDQARWRARDRHELLLARTAQRRDRVEQAPRVRVLWAGEQQLGRRGLDDPPGVHHGDVVGHLGDDAEVVRDDHDRHPELALQALEQRENLRLHGHVERRRRLVGDQQLRLVGERHRDHRALAHAAGELVRVFLHAPRRVGDADESEQLDRACSRLRLGDVLMHAHGLDQLRADLEERVQRGQRVLEDHRDVVAADRAHLDRRTASRGLCPRTGSARTRALPARVSARASSARRRSCPSPTRRRSRASVRHGPRSSRRRQRARRRPRSGTPRADPPHAAADRLSARS